MNVLTGAVLSLLLLCMLYGLAYEEGSIEFEISAHVAAFCIVMAALLVGHWTAVLLGRL